MYNTHNFVSEADLSRCPLALYINIEVIQFPGLLYYCSLGLRIVDETCAMKA